ncbi:uncharacterized protein LOC132296592 [Cornus florida]|uniref:uncharacterized protein LOC132296592 n=1 Tax=Cornus florida TaxID=4283 RepID=UPI00289EF38A|nr:uncharacterized protein LOC132296592 [Cornus florida]
MESIFAVIGAAEDQKVNLATFMFKNEASYWWDTTKHLLLTPGEKEVIFGNPFVKAFYEKYFPPIYRKEKEREFILLKQDRMSVVDYEVKFTALSRFAPKFVQNEEDKCTKFQDGLEATIKSRVSVFEETDYNRLVNIAMIAERDVKELQERRVQYKRNRSEPSQSRGGEGIASQKSQRSRYGRGRGGESQGQTSSIRRGQGLSEQQSVQQGSFGGRGTGRGCFQCGREGHQKKDCPILKAEECYHCHQPSHRKRDCPMLTGMTSVGSVPGSGKGFAQGNSSRGGKGVTSGSQAQGRVFAMTLQDAQATPEVVTGTLSILDRNVTVLIDPSSTHSFVASSIAMHLGRPLSLLDSKLFISTPMGEVVVVANEYRDCVLQLGDRQLKVNLIPLGIPDFDISLGMNWLSAYHASIDCFQKEVVFQVPGEPEFRFTGERNVIPNSLISAIQTRKLLKKGCQGYLAYVIDPENKDMTLENVPVTGR